MDPSKRLFWWKPGHNKPRTPSKTYETYLRLLSLIDAAAGLLCTSRVQHRCRAAKEVWLRTDKTSITTRTCPTPEPHTKVDVGAAELTRYCARATGALWIEKVPARRDLNEHLRKQHQQHTLKCTRRLRAHETNIHGQQHHAGYGLGLHSDVLGFVHSVFVHSVFVRSVFVFRQTTNKVYK